MRGGPGQFGYCLRVTRKDETELRQKDKVKAKKISLNLLQTRKDGVLFHDGKLASFAEEYAGLSRQFQEEQKKLVAKVTRQAA